MATVLDRGIQALADVTGFVIDRTITPEKVIGQAWIISKSRVVILASRVSNYAEAPWALLVRFPHPDLEYGVKAMNFHPDFNKRTVRDHYLAQLKELSPAPGIFDNDIGTLTLDPELPELPPDKVLELNRALSLPLQISPQDLSGVMKYGETGNILQKALMSGRSGVLSFFDDRKVPFARIAIKQGKVTRAVYQGMINEFAVCELMWRKPGGNFVMQSDDNFAWPNIPEIGMPTDQLASEAIRRTQELPRLLETLGGPDAAYAKARPNADFNQITPNNRWCAERLWAVIDGYLPVSKLADRVQADSYTAVLALAELKGTGQVTMTPGGQMFHRNGQLSPPLTPANDLDLNVWDPLHGFYLDEFSGAPILATGNYFGAVSLIQPRTLVHTVSFPAATHGAAVLKDGKLVGLHNGRFVPLNPQNVPPVPCSQMIWIGSLSDTGSRRLRAAEQIEPGHAGDESALGGRTTTGVQQRQAPSVPLNDEPAQAPPSDEPEILQKFSKIQILGAGAGMFVLGLFMSLGAMMAPKPAPAPVATTTTVVRKDPTAKGPVMSADVASAVQVAQQYAGFRKEAFQPYAYESTAAKTEGKLSFGISGQGTKIMFVVWPQVASPNVVKAVFPHLPFLNWRSESRNNVPIADGEEQNDLYWQLGSYAWFDDKQKRNSVQVLIGNFPSAQNGQSILFFALPSSDLGNVDFQGALSIVQRMRAGGAGAATAGGATPGGGGDAGAVEATPEQIEAYRTQITEQLKTSFKAPEEAEGANKASVVFGIGETGNLTKLELKESSGEPAVDKALRKLVESKVPFPPPPRSKRPILIEITLVEGQLKFSEP